MEENKEKKCEGCDSCKDKNVCCCCRHHYYRHCKHGRILRIILYLIVFGIIIHLVFTLFGFGGSRGGSHYGAGLNYYDNFNARPNSFAPAGTTGGTMNFPR
jgi:hypothetical protein